VQVTVGEAVAAYELELKSLGRADHTIRVYRRYLRDFAESCGERTSVASIDPGKVTRYFAGIGTQSNRNGAITALKGFMAWAVRMKYISPSAAANALGGRKFKTIARQPKHYIAVDDFPALLDAAGETHPIERAVIALALFTLCRASEITAIRLRDIDLPGRTLRVWRKKRQRWTDVAISPDLYAELAQWLNWYAEASGFRSTIGMLREHPDWHLIPRWLYEKPVNRQGRYYSTGKAILSPDREAVLLENVVKRALNGLGVRTRNGKVVEHYYEGIHTIRRSGSRALLDHLEGNMGADRALLMVSAMLDHENPQVTLRYIGRDIEKQRLDDFLRSNSMYGLTGQSHQASILMMPARAALR
jgi:integrase